MAFFDPKALLNPKGQAKEKTKKRPQHYGPQQSRKPASAEASGTMPSLSTGTVLNPQAAQSSSTVSSGEPSATGHQPINGGSASDQDDSFQGVGSFMERFHNLSNREAPPLKKRKVEATEEAPTDEDDQRPKSTFQGAKSNGILSEHIREERERAAKESGPEAIDLTKDDDEEVEYLESRVIMSGEDTREVCLGMLHSQANVHHIPRYPKNLQNALGKGMYPQLRVNYKRMPGSTNIIDLYDRSTNGDRLGSKFGKIEVKTAAGICPLLDGEEINGLKISIFLERAPKQVGEYEMARVSRSIPIKILLNAPKGKAKGIGKALSQRQLFLESPVGVPNTKELFNPHEPTTFGPKPQSSSKRKNGQPSYGVVRTQEEMVRETTSMFDNLIKAAEVKEMEANQAAIKTELKGLQKQALHFLTQHERADLDGTDSSQVSLWRQRETTKGTVWANVITNHELRSRPEPVRGGILADEMGLGKTLSILALHAATCDEAEAFGKEEPPLGPEHVERNAKATLIICPTSVMSNWAEQIKTHTKGRFFKTYQYHGQNRTQDLDKLSEYDIVLAPYGTVSSEDRNKNGSRNALASINWFRIVLDEGHSIRNPKTNCFRSCCALTAQRRWAVTGTPVQNHLDDLGALFKFLRIKPFDDEISWGKHIMAPLKTADEHVLQHLQLLVASVTLRRTKDSLGLPKRVERQEKLEFSPEERAMYAQFSGQANLQVRAMMRDKGRIQGKGYAFMLRSIHRLRVICAHGEEMLSEDDRKELEGLTAQTAIELGDEPDGELDSSFITEGQAYDFLDMMFKSESDLCTRCSKKIVQKNQDERPQESGPSSEASDSDDEDSEEERDPESELKNDVLGYINPCYDHLICPDCKDDYVQKARAEQREDGYHHCPYCDNYIRFGLFELKLSSLRAFYDSKQTKSKKEHTKWNESNYSGPHTKVKALLNDLKQSAEESKKLPRGESPIKSVVFSGWTTYLDLIEYALDEHSIQYTRLDGTMSVSKRSKVLDDFKNDDDITVILVSIKAGGQGLNLTKASRVYMMEPQFNPGVEQQAIDRVHRMGQDREVEIKHYIMEGSIEEKIQEMQKKKERLAKVAMDKKMRKKEDAKQRAEDLRELFK